MNTRAKLIEAIAMTHATSAVGEWYGLPWYKSPTPWDDLLYYEQNRYLMIADISLSAIEAAGCVVVPVVATQNMAQDIDEAFDAARVGNGDIADIWDAALAASPFAPETKP